MHFRPVSSAGAVTTGVFTVTAPPWGCNQSQCHCGKATSIDQFTGEVRQITSDDWLSIFERVTIWNEWTQDELLMQITGYLIFERANSIGIMYIDSKPLTILLSISSALDHF